MPPPPADLLRALHDLAPEDDATAYRIAQLLQPAWTPPASVAPKRPQSAWSNLRGKGGAERAKQLDTALTSIPVPRRTGLPVFATLTLIDAAETQAPDWLAAPAALPVPETDPGPPPSPPPLLRSEQARGILVAALGAVRDTREVDVAAVVGELARGHEIRRLPRVRVRSVAPRVQLLVDRGASMLPFVADGRSLARDAERVLGADRLELLRFDGCPIFGAGTGPRRTWSADYAAYRPAAGTCVLVATDLGIGSPGGTATAAWIAFAREVRRAGCRLVALVPFGPDRWPLELRRRIELVHWDRTTTAGRAATFVRRSTSSSPRARAEGWEALAELCAFAVRVDPALVRTLRLELLPGLDAGVEADLWASTLARFRGPDGLVLDQQRADALRLELSAANLQAYDAAWAVTERLHRHLPQTIRLQEELQYLYRRWRTGLDPRVAELLRAAVATVVHDASLAPWATRALSDLPAVLRDSEEGQMLRTAAHLRLRDRLVATSDLPPGRLPEWVGWVSPDDLGGVEVGVSLFDDRVELSEPPTSPHVIELPRTRPLVVEIDDQRVEFEPGSTSTVEVDGDVSIRTALGRTWSLARARIDPVDLLLHRDPMVSRTALEDLVHLPRAIPAVVDRIRDLPETTVVTVRELLARFPEISGPLMLDRIFKADDDWHAAVMVPKCMSPTQLEVCEKPLVERLDRPWAHIDALRLSIEALGHLGAVGQAPAIAGFLAGQDDPLAADLFDKYQSYCVEALARIAVRAREATGPLLALDSTVRLVSARGWRHSGLRTVQEIMSRCTPPLAELLNGEWLRSEFEDLRDIAAYALGGTGDERYAGALLERALDPSETERVRRTAMFAAGVSGGVSAVEGLARLDVEGELVEARDTALSLCVGDAWNDQRFRELVPRLLAGRPYEPMWVLRAIGVRRDETLVPILRDGLADRETSVRGDAALALGRILGPGARGELLKAWTSATSTRERILFALGLLLAGAAPPSDPELHELSVAMAEESVRYRSRTQRDILETLRSVDHPNAAAIARAWEPIYATSSAY